MSKEDKEVFKNTTICEVCKRGFTAEDYKVKHHDRITGKFVAGIIWRNGPYIGGHLAFYFKLNFKHVYNLQ